MMKKTGIGVVGCGGFCRGNHIPNLLGVNPNYLGGVLRKKLHSTFREQLTRKRLEEAEILLRLHPGLSIGKIAFKCGFADSNYFSAVFRRKRGMTPTQCRRSPQH